MIYYIQIKNLNNLYSKYFFRTLPDMFAYFDKILSDEMTIVHKEEKQILSGLTLENYIENCMEILMIDDDILPEYKNYFDAKFYKDKLKNEPAS